MLAGENSRLVAVAVRDPLTGERLTLCLTFVSQTLSRADRLRAIDRLLQERKILTRTT